MCCAHNFRQVAAMPYRVLLADDCDTMRDGVRLWLTSNQVEVVGEAHNGQEAIDKCDPLRPDIVLMDLRMPVIDGIEATKIITQKWSDIRVVFFTGYGEDIISDVFRSGARGYISKQG